MNVEPVTLVSPTGRVRLEPLRLDHAEALFEAVDDAETWRLRPDSRPRDAGEMHAKIAVILKDAVGVGTGLRLPFAIVTAEDGRVAGTTGFLDIDRASRSLEIGATILGPRWQRTFVNTECKLTLMTHVFETLGAVRVAYKIDMRNVRSQRAVERLGAVREGVLRKNKICHDGFIRDTAVYSIVDDEWPRVRTHLRGLIAAHGAV